MIAAVRMIEFLSQSILSMVRRTEEPVRTMSETKAGTSDTEEVAPAYVADAQNKVLVVYTPNWGEAVIIRRHSGAHLPI